MSISPSYSLMAKAVLLAGVLLAIFLLSSSWHDTAYAQETIEYPENGDSTVVAYTAVDPEEASITWTLDGDDAGDFSIENGALTFNSPPDYENPDDSGINNTYEVTVIASDGSVGSTDAMEMLVITVTNLEEDGTVTMSALQPQEEVALTAKLVDHDGGDGVALPIDAAKADLTDAATWQWARSQSKTTGWADIEDETSKTYTPVADDVNMYLRATATYDDGEGDGKNAHMVSVNTVREKPYINASPVFRDTDGEVITSPIDRSVPENSPAGTAVGDPVTATDDARDVLTYTISANSNFTVDSGTGQIKVATGASLDHEGPGIYTVIVTVTDPSNESDEVTVTISVTDVNEPPTIATGDAAVDYAEIKNGTSNTDTVETYTADDVDQNEIEALTWSVSGPDGDKFSIATNGELTFTDPPDFEAKADANSNNVYEVTVVVTDTAGNTASQAITVNVTNEQEEGTITLFNLRPEDGIRFRAELTDPDGEITRVTWQWSGNGNGATSATYTPDSNDVGQTLTVTATYTDGAGQDTTTADSALQVQAADTDNQPPEFPDQDPNTPGDQRSRTSREVNENTMDGVDIGTPVQAEDEETSPMRTDPLTYSLNGRDDDSFSIDPASGQLSTKAALNYETKSTYTVIVTATDPSDESVSITVTINVMNVDEPPDVTGGETSITYAENGAGTVTTFRATDPERATIVWTLEDNDNDDFDISRGVLSFKNPPNFEAAADTGTDNVYNVTVIAGDGGADTTTPREVTVTVTNVDEPGTVILSAVQPQEEVQLTATLEDPDEDVSAQAWQWAIASSRNGTYTDIEDAGSTCDPEAPNCYKPDKDDVGKYLRVTVTYKDEESAENIKTAHMASTHSVRAKPYVNAPPVFNDADGEKIPDGDGVSRSVAENSRPGSPVGDPVVATDDARDVLTYSLDTGADAASFSIDRMTGQIRVGPGASIDYEDSSNNDHAYAVMVTAADPAYPQAPDSRDTIGVTITVTDVDEDPSIEAETQSNGRAAISYEEKATDAVDTYSAADPEDYAASPRKDLMWSLSGVDRDKFSIDASGVLTFKTSPNFEAPADTGRNNRYDVTVVVTDSGGNTDSRNVTVTIDNVDEDGVVTLSTVQPEDGVTLTASLEDPDGGVTGVKWQWASSTSNSDLSDSDNVDGATSASYKPTADDENNYLWAIARYTDREGGNKTARMVSEYQVQPYDTSNKPPKFPDQDDNTAGDQKDQTREVMEDGDTPRNDRNVGDEPVAAVDCDGAATCDSNTDNLTYSLGGTDAAFFSIDDRKTGQITIADGIKLDYESTRTYTVTVTATDPSYPREPDSRDTITVTITVTNVNEMPVLSREALVIVGNRVVDYVEHETGTAATYIAAGMSATGVTWSLSGDDAGDFSISGGDLTFNNVPDYENPADSGADNEYNITVHARDSGRNTAELEVTVRVANADEDGEVTLSSTQPVVGVQLTASLTDPDGDIANEAWQWAESRDGATGWTDIADATSETYTPDAADTGVYLRATVRYTDGEGTGKRAEAVSGAVSDVPQDGVVSLLPATAEVGVTLTATLTDPDGGVTNVTWQWARSQDRSTGWADIANATSNTYTPDSTDAGYYLRATASYDDAEASGQTASVVTGAAVLVVQNGVVTLSSTEPVVGDEITATLSDPDLGPIITGLRWQWSKSPDGSTGWTDISGATSDAYTSDATDAGYYLRATASYSDSNGPGQTASAETGEVAATAQNGVVTLPPTDPVAGVELTARLSDPDLPPLTIGLTWQWARSPDGLTGWTDIAGATSATYTPVSTDEGYYLRATVAYTDSTGPGQTAEAVTGAAVVVDLLTRYDANGNGQIDRDEAIKAVQDYFSNLISREDVLEVIRLYFAAAS